jgi:hypothetical protein
LISSQNTDFILAARKAFQDHRADTERARWLGRPYTAAGLIGQTKPLVDNHILVAAALTALTMDVALAMLVRALQSKEQPPEHTFVPSASYPKLEDLKKR